MKYKGLDILRGLAAFGIVGVHLALSPMSEAWCRLHALCDMNVGLFAAISGFLMYKSVKGESFIDYAKKRCCRLLPVYFVWTAIYILFGFLFDIFVRHGLNEKWLAWDFYPKVIFGGQSSAHLWFLICLLYIQIIMMSIKQYLVRMYWLAILCVGFSIVAVSSVFMDIWMFGYPCRMLGFVLSGYAVRMRTENLPTCGKGILTAYVGICVFAIIAHLTIRTPPCIAFLKDWFVAMLILMVFISIRTIPNELHRLVQLLGATSMGVYLLHPILTAGVGIVIRKLFLPPFGLGAVFLDWIVCYTMALVCSIIICRKPVLNRFAS